MIRKIVRYPDPVLRAKCRDVTTITPEIRTLVTDMLETMHEANGIGLAAPQVGVDVQLAVIDLALNPDSISYMKIDGQKVAMPQHMPVIKDLLHYVWVFFYVFTNEAKTTFYVMFFKYQ